MRRSASAPVPGLGVPRTSGPVRAFAGSRGQPRFRRATDLLLLLPSLLALALLVAAYPPSRFERSLDLFLRSFPDWLAPLWGFFYDGLAVWAVALLVAAVILRRPAVLLDALCAVAVAAAVTVVATRLATGEWPDVGALVRLRADDSTFPVVRTATVAAVVLVIGPHLVQPLQRFGRYLLLLGIAGALLSQHAPPSAQLAALVVAFVAASVVRLALGTSAGYPRSGDVLAAVRELGVRAEQLEPAARQAAGVFHVLGADDASRPLLVKVYGRDAYDTQLVATLWRNAWYRGRGVPLFRLSRLEAAEHEAFVTLLARSAGLATLEVVTAAATVDDSRRPPRALGQLWPSSRRSAARNAARRQAPPGSVAGARAPERGEASRTSRSTPGALGAGRAARSASRTSARRAFAPDAAQLLADRAQTPRHARSAAAGTERALRLGGRLGRRGRRRRDAFVPPGRRVHARAPSRVLKALPASTSTISAPRAAARGRGRAAGPDRVSPRHLVVGAASSSRCSRSRAYTIVDAAERGWTGRRCAVRRSPRRHAGAGSSGGLRGRPSCRA